MDNITVDYNDMLEGDRLACRPGNVAPGLEYLCEYCHPILGVAASLAGLSFFNLFVQGRRFQKSIARHLGGTATVGNARDRDERPSRRKTTSALGHSEKVVLTLGTMCVSCGLPFIVNGWGTMYSSQHIRGQIGDFFGKYKAHFGVMMHASRVASQKPNCGTFVVGDKNACVSYIKVTTQKKHSPYVNNNFDILYVSQRIDQQPYLPMHLRGTFLCCNYEPQRTFNRPCHDHGAAMLTSTNDLE
jgi:hypothetical protein